MDARFKLPFVMQVSGPSQSGKTHWVSQLILYRQALFDQPLKGVYWFSPHTSLPDNLQSEDVKLLSGLPWDEEIEEELAVDVVDGHVLYVLDDFGMETRNSKELTNFFTKHSHHRNISLIQIIQSLFWPSAEGRTRSLNVHYFCIMKNLRDTRQIKILARQITSTNKEYEAFMQAHNQATRKPYSYLLISLHPRDDNQLMLRSEIFPEESPSTSVYLLHRRPLSR